MTDAGLLNLGSAFDADAARQLEAVFEAMYDGVWVCDSTPRLLWINSACEKLNEIQRADVCGRRVAELLEQGNFDHDVSTEVLRRRQPVAINQKVKSGRTLLVNGVPVFDERGDIAYVVGTERDLTELNMLRGELDHSREITRKINAELLALKMKDLKLAEIVAESEAMGRVLDTALRVAGFDATVLLAGPSGSGKTLIAKVIHEGSGRREKPFLSLNCGAIPASLLEAELFGYAAGAFTGASKSGKPGLLEAANGGTLFLDEIDAFGLELQVKLLTVLDTQSFIRVGDTSVRQVDVRLITATNRDLGGLVESGDFREDLWYRLNVVPIRLPPLTDRPADIPVLAGKILERLSRRYEVDRSLSPEALDMLCRYDFPGNVRELQNLLERSFVLCRSDRIGVAELPAEIREAVPMAVRGTAAGSYKQALREVEHDWLLRSCARHNRQVDVARELGVSQATVARLLKKHGLQIDRENVIQD